MSVYTDVAMRLNKTHCFKCELHVVHAQVYTKVVSLCEEAITALLMRVIDQ